jgi:hypothetical protein
MRRGEVWFINLDPAIGAEIRKTRPAVIVNDDAIGILPLKVIVPITDWKERYAVAPLDGEIGTIINQWPEQIVGGRCISSAICVATAICTSFGRACTRNYDGDQ